MKITQVHEEGGLILWAKYHESLSDDQNTVETEGYYHFQEPKLNVPFDQVTEEMIVGWINDGTTQNGVNAIKSRLQDQLSSLRAAKSVNLPWEAPIFTVEL